MVAPVLVVGAGPTGLVAALLLADLGVACTLVERDRGVRTLPRAVHLDDEAVRVLQRAGLAGEFAAISRVAPGLRLVDGRRRPFAEFRRAELGVHGHPESNLFHQPDLERLLRAAVERAPLVTLREGVELVACGSPQAPRAVLRDVGTGRTEEFVAAAVLGCDGAASTVRRMLGARWRDLRFAERWFVLDALGAPPPGWGGVDQICDPRRAATSVPLPGGRHRWELRMHPGETADALRARIGELTGVPGLRVERAAEYVFRARLADRWRDGRVLLLGDAAHQTPPFVGHGLGAGLRDAHDLAWKLAAVLSGAPAAGTERELLDSYTAERSADVEAAIRAAVRVGRALTGGPGVLAPLRRPVAAALLRVPVVRRRAERALVVRRPAGPLVDRTRHRRDLVGTTCPQPAHDGRPLDEVLGSGFALLVAGPVPPALAERARALGARTVPVGADGTTLRAWLHRGRAVAVLLRPDRVVLASAPGRLPPVRVAPVQVPRSSAT